MRPTSLAILILVACGSAPPPAAHQHVATSGALALTYDGAAFEGPGLLDVTLVAADGVEHAMRLDATTYSVFADCSACPPDRPIQENMPTPGGPPAVTYAPGVIARFEGAAFGKDVIAECPAGGRCIRTEPFPAGTYAVRVGGGLRCAGSVTVPLAAETDLTCTR